MGHQSLGQMGMFVSLRGKVNFDNYLNLAKKKTVLWKTNVSYDDYYDDLCDTLNLGDNRYYGFQFYPGVVKRF